jgi:hypothetical protein
VNTSKEDSKKMYEDINNAFIVLIPSTDGKLDISTMINLYDIAFGLDKKPMFVQSQVTSLLFARTEIFSVIKKMSGKDKVRGLMLDSDIIIPINQVKKITEEIIKADKENYNFVLPYPTSNGSSIYDLKGEKIIQIDDISEFMKMDKAYASGLGFYYGDLPLDYKFRTDNNMGEDINFFIDNSISPKVIKEIEILHYKRVRLGIFHSYW